LDHPFDVNRVEFSFDGSKILTCGRDPLFTKCYAQVWDAQNGKPVGSQMFHGDGVIYATFSPDASRVASSGEDDLARTWLAATGQPLAPMELNHGNHVQSVAFSRDGAWITTASSDSTARVWSALTGDPLTPPLLHKERLTSSIFLPDGTHIVTGDREGNFFLWELPPIVRPASELRRLARLMSTEKNNLVPNLPRKSKGTGSQEPLESLWADLKKGCPEQFMVSATQIAAWHQREADASLAEGNQEAARFHLKKLLEIKPSASADVERVTEGTDQHEKSH
jgi:WD40 repeat protein